MANHRYYAELGVDASEAVKAFGESEKSATSLTNTLDALGIALGDVDKTGKKAAEGQGRTLKLYQQLTSAAGGYGRAMKSLADPAVAKGAREMEGAFRSMRTELDRIAKTPISEEQSEQIGRTLNLYKQLAQVSQSYTASLRNEAQAIKAVADASGKREAASRVGTGAARGTTETGAGAEARTTARAHDELATATSKSRRETELSAAAQANQERALASTRYALYEVAAAYTAVAAGAAVLPIGGARAAIEMEAQFAHVARTTQATAGPLRELREGFRDLSTEIPISFEELSRIGTLGAQMDIPIAALEEFTDVVAKFSATTDVSVDTAAMAFGRLANMIDDVDVTQFRNLGSAISEMGTNSVATESEILSIAESIATSANMAGFGADEIVGLSTALASLRVRPEMARGAMQRIFASINKAVTDGTETFQNYADALGMTTEAAEEMYRTDPSQFLMRVAQAVDQIGDGVAQSQFIREGLGLRNVRDVEMLNRLANGYETYAASMDLAADAYARGNYLETEASVIFETTAASLEQLGNAVTAMLASFGDTSLGPIKLVADTLTAMLNALRDLPGWAKSSVSFLALMVAGVAAFRAALALGIASMRAFRLVNQNLATTGAVNAATFRREWGLTFGQFISGANASSAAATGLTATTRTAAAGAATATTATRTLWATISAHPLGAVVTVAGLAASALWGWAASANEAEEAAERMARQFADAGGGFEDFNRAIIADREAIAQGAETLATFEGQVYAASSATTQAASNSGVYLDAQNEIRYAAEEATRAIETQTIAIGENADEWLRRALVNTEGIQDAPREAMESLITEFGFSINELMETWYADGSEGLANYVENVRSKLQEAFGEMDRFEQAQAQRHFQAMSGVLDSVLDSEQGMTGILEEFVYQQQLLGNAGLDLDPDPEDKIPETTEELKEFNDVLKGSIDEMFNLVDAEAAVYAAMDRLGKSLDENGASLDLLTEGGRANMEALRNYISAVGEDISANVEAGVISADRGAQMFADAVADIIYQLEQLGVDTSQFDEFHDHIVQLFAQEIGVNINTEAALKNLENLAAYGQAVFESLRAQGVSRGMAASGARYSAQARALGVGPVSPSIPEQVRTGAQTLGAHRNLSLETARTRAEQERLNKEKEKGRNTTRDTTDQARKLRQEIEDINDPARIFEETMKELSNAFKDTLNDFNNLQSHRDSLEMRLINMREAAQATKDEIRDLREEAAKLRREAAEERATERQARHFASVAARYGDDLRQEQYTVEAREAAAAAREKERLAKTAVNEANALDKNRLSLTGYSKQAIENRNAVRDLQNEMADLIIAYAETGASQQDVERYAEQLRRKFVDQLTQMGYNRRDVRRLSEVFVDLKRDIDRVPRQVRIKAQADTAEARRKIRDLAKTQTVPLKFRAPSQDVTVTGDLVVRNVRSNEVKTNTVRTGGGGAPYAMFRRGGVIPGTASSSYDNMLGVGHRFDGMVSVRSGEGIVSEPALKRMGGEPWLNAVNSMKAPPPMVVVNAPNGPATQDVNLLPQNINAIARAVSTVLAVDGKVIAATTNAQNTRAARRGAN